MTILGVRPDDIDHAGTHRLPDEPAGVGVDRVSLFGTAAAISLWLSVGLVAYVALAWVVLLYFPSADRLPSGTAADAAYVLTAPLVLALMWFAAVRNRG